MRRSDRAGDEAVEGCRELHAVYVTVSYYAIMYV